MRFFVAVLILSLCVVEFGCKEQGKPDSDNLSSFNHEDSLEFRRMEENQLKTLYNSCEKLLRKDGVQDQEKINLIMQLMIDGGDLVAPFVYEDDNERKILSYKEYKKYRREHPLDTNSIYTLQLSLPQDTFSVDTTQLRRLLK